MSVEIFENYVRESPLPSVAPRHAAWENSLLLTSNLP
nr:MAG TPA: hypothetical protein [Bacteriophage sp.]